VAGQGQRCQASVGRPQRTAATCRTHSGWQSARRAARA
jgi:hypothetical protein